MAEAAPGALARRRQGDHDHRHVPEGRDRDARARRATVTINGIAKGAGMIAPDMATMLAFVFTDAPIAAPALQALLADGRRRHLQRRHRRRRHLDLRHAAGVRDRRRGDAGAPKIARANDPRLKAFRAAFEPVLADLAEQVARDGEGARKLVEIVVEGAASKTLGAAHRAVDRQLAAGEDRDRRRGRQLGPRRDGGRQGRRAGRPRQALDLVRRHPRRPQGRARSRLRRGRGLGAT